MTADRDDLVVIDLENVERELMVLVLNEYAGTAQQAFELIAPVVGKTSRSAWGDYVFMLKEAIKNKEPLSDLDWARVLFLTEVGFASDLVGSGRRFGRGADEYWIVVLRSLQDKISNYRRLPAASRQRCLPPDDMTADKDDLVSKPSAVDDGLEKRVSEPHEPG